MSKHTPGPWTVGPDSRDKLSLCIVSKTGYNITDVTNSQQGRADARLIAAAPNLLQVLKDIVVHEEGRKKVSIGYDALVHLLAHEVIAEIEEG